MVGRKGGEKGLRMSWRFRDDVRAGDPAAVRALATATGFFRPAEIDVAVELVGERLTKGEASGYFFVFASAADDPGDDAPAGYACWGPTPCTVSGTDLYWLIVDPSRQGGGLGRELLRRVAAAARARGGTKLYADTSGMALYAPTRAFYLHLGFREIARLPEFYAPGDDKVVYVKTLDAE